MERSPSPSGHYRPGVVLRDAWYGVAHSAAVRRSRPLARTIDGTSIALWRDGTGAIRAVEDRCAHRRAPLSDGKVVDGTLQCPYHGWCYDACGAVVRIPSLGPGVAPSARFTVPSYPVVVRYGIVWLWWGDPSRADPALVPVVPFLEPDAPPPAGGDIHYSAPQELVVENLLDLTHLDVVHGAIFGDPFGGVEEVSVEHTDEVIVMRRVSRDRRPPQLMRHMMGNPERQDIAQTFYSHVRSGVTFGIAWNTPPGWGFCLLMCNTPETPATTRVTAAIRVIGAPWLYRKLLPVVSTQIVARQDERILRRQTRRYLDGDPRADKSVPADAAGLRYRQLRAALAERQDAGDFSYRDAWRGPDPAAAILMDGRIPDPA
jgi:phenylpropionate dioxygenase-like ring-hydroxylating dioxygenase large terminal subunit